MPQKNKTKTPAGWEPVEDNATPAGWEAVDTAMPTEDIDKYAWHKGDQHGHYRMKSPSGKDVDVPYDKVMLASRDGWKIHPDDRTTYADDYVDEMRKKAIADVRSKNKGFIPGLDFVSKFAIQHAMNPNTDLPQAYDVVSEAPKVGSLDWVKSKVMGVERAILDQFPTIGGIAGGTGATALTAESGPGVIPARMAGAGFGGASGEKARQEIESMLVPYEHRPTPEENNRRIKIEAGVMAGAEGLGLASGKLLAPAQEYLADTALASEKTGIRMLPSEARGEAPTWGEKILKGNILTKGVMDRFRTAQNEEAKAAVNKIIDSISNFKGDTEELGKLVQEGIDTHKKEFRRLENYLYNDIAKDVNERTVKVPVYKLQETGILDASGKMGMRSVPVGVKDEVIDDVMPSTKGLKAFAKEKLAELDQQQKIMDPALLAKARAMLEAIEKSPDRMPFSAVKNARSDYLGIARQLDQALEGKAAGFAKKMAILYDESMMDAAEKSGIKGLPEKIRAANAFVAEEHRKFEMKLVDDIVASKEPSLIAKAIRTGKLDETRDLMSVIPKNLQDPVRQQVIWETMEEATDPLNGSFNERKFALNILKLRDKRGVSLFGDNWKNVKELAQTMGRINGPVGMSGSAAALQNAGIWRKIGNAGANIATLGAAPVGLFGTGHPLAAVASVPAEWAALRTIAYSMTNPAATARMLRIAQAFSRVVPYASAGIVNSGRGEKIGKGEGPDEKRLNDVKQKAHDLQDMFHKSGLAPAPSPAEGTGPQSRNQTHTHIWDEKSGRIIPV